MEVTAAIIRRKGCYLIAKRKRDAVFGDLWEFPGGKRRTGESLEDCLQREMKEEIGVDVGIHDLLLEVLYPYPHITLILYFYKCSIRSGKIRPLASQELRWVPPEKLRMYKFPPANTPLLGELIRT